MLALSRSLNDRVLAFHGLEPLHLLLLLLNLGHARQHRGAALGLILFLERLLSFLVRPIRRGDFEQVFGGCLDVPLDVTQRLRVHGRRDPLRILIYEDSRFRIYQKILPIDGTRLLECP